MTNIRRRALALTLAAGVSGCGSDRPPASSAPSGTTSTRAARIEGRRSFVIVPAESKASYRANEEFFGGALKLLGIDAGKVEAVGSTQEVEGRFDLDPGRPNELLGENFFSVRVDSLVSNQSKRDDYVREIRDDGGPSFYAYPRVTFKATSVAGQSNANDAGWELGLVLDGDLTIRDITKPTRFDVKAQLTGETLTGTGTTRLLLSGFGIGPIEFAEVLRVADEVGLELQFTARAQ